MNMNVLPLLECYLEFPFLQMGAPPLMLASLRGGSSDMSDEDEDEDSSANIITDLVYQGASLQAQTDRTGEMAPAPRSPGTQGPMLPSAS